MIDHINPQNEFASDNNYPTCVWTGEQMRTFIAEHLGPALEHSGLDTGIYLGTINGTGTHSAFAIPTARACSSSKIPFPTKRRSVLAAQRAPSRRSPLPHSSLCPERKRENISKH